MSIWTVVVAAGRGDRFGADKQSADLCGRAVLERSVVAAGGSDGVVVVVAPTAVEEVAERFAGVDKVSAVVAGGATRSASVRAGLVVVPDDASIVLVHDGARPLATRNLFDAVVAAVRDGADAVVPGVPVINFATGNPALIPLLAESGSRVVGVDWRIRLDEAWNQIGHDRSIQGNLDPLVLLASPQEIRQRASAILDQADGRPGHIFNLGHGVLPQTPVENAIALVDAVHELSQRTS